MHSSRKMHDGFRWNLIPRAAPSAYEPAAGRACLLLFFDVVNAMALRAGLQRLNWRHNTPILGGALVRSNVR
jgi:hypothetical protein